MSLDVAKQEIMHLLALDLEPGDEFVRIVPGEVTRYFVIVTPVEYNVTSSTFFGTFTATERTMNTQDRMSVWSGTASYFGRCYYRAGWRR